MFNKLLNKYSNPSRRKNSHTSLAVSSTIFNKINWPFHIRNISHNVSPALKSANQVFQ